MTRNERQARHADQRASRLTATVREIQARPYDWRDTQRVARLQAEAAECRARAERLRNLSGPVGDFSDYTQAA
jgi:hypothetical protein